MAYAQDITPGDGSTLLYSISFPYLKKDHVKVYVDGEPRTYTWNSPGQITLDGPAPGVGVPVLRRRETPVDKKTVDFKDASSLTEENLDAQGDQLLYIVQENLDSSTAALRQDDAGVFDAKDIRIQNVAEPLEDSDASTKAYTDQITLSVEADRIAAEVARVGAEAAQFAAETAQGASETAQGQSEANALASAASAQEAQDWVEMIGKYDVIRITSNYNLTAANLGNMIAVDASAGPVDVIVPSITVLGEPFHWRVKKIDTTTNQVRVVSPDKIDGFDDPYVITATNAGATFQTDNDVENNIVTSAFGASANVVSRPFFFTATEGQTTFTGPDDYGNTLAYTPGKLIQVVVDGDVIDTRGMTAADGISIVFHEPLVAGQQVFCEPFASFAVASTYSSGEIDSLLTRVQNGYIGEVIPMAGNTLPNGLLWCDGSEVSRTTYADLFAYLGTIWGAGDGSTTFNLPDLREWFLRGASDAYPVGSEQLDQFQGHLFGDPDQIATKPYMAVLNQRYGGTNDPASNALYQTSSNNDNNAAGAFSQASAMSDGVNGTPRVGDETRPKNKAVRFAIKAFHPVRILTSGAEGVSKAGDLMTGSLRLAGDAVLDDEAVTKRQFDALNNRAYVETGERVVITNILPLDDTLPQITEGAEVLSTVITPSRAGAVFEVTGTVRFTLSANYTGTIAIFAGVSTDAIAIAAHTPGTAGNWAEASATATFVAPDTNPINVALRAGGNTSGTMYVNGFAGGRIGGGALKTFLLVKEIA